MEFCVLRVFIFLYANCQYLLVEEHKVNDCVKFYETGRGY